MGSIGTGGTPSKPRNGGLSGLPAVCSRSNRNYKRCFPAPTRFHPCGGTTRAGRRAFLSFPFVGEMARRSSEQKHAAARLLISTRPVVFHHPKKPTQIAFASGRLRGA